MNLIFFNDTAAIAKRYFLDAEHKTSALAYFFAIIVIIVLMVGLNYALSLSLAVFWASLTSLNYHAFISSLLITSALMFGHSLLSVLRNFLTEMLIMNWRAFLSLALIEGYLNPEKKAYLFFSHTQEVNHLGQHLQTDVRTLTDKTINLGFDFFAAVLNICMFTYSLWHIGGHLSFIMFGIHFFIPGYLIIAAILLSLIANFITYHIGQQLNHLINSRLIEDAQFRTEIEKVHEHAECIAQAKSSQYHHTKLTSIFTNAQAYSFSILYEKIKLNGFQSFFASFAKLFPYIIASPLYFAGKLSISSLNQAAYAFTELARAMAWFQHAVKDIAELSAASQRLTTLYQHLDNLPQQHIIRTHNAQYIEFNLTQVKKPNGEVLFRNLQFQLNPKENVLIRGPSGLGKSTIFKSLAENWPYAEGDIAIPQNESLMFLPQKAFIPAGDFRSVLSYPASPDIHTDNTYHFILETVGLHQFGNDLNTKKEWANILSGGEQQRVQFARAILTKPTWLFMDESSSSLDQSSEVTLYLTLKSLLQQTTIISIAHHDTVKAFHDKIIELSILPCTQEVQINPHPLASAHRYC